MSKRRVDMDDLRKNDGPIFEALRRGRQEAMRRHIAAGAPMIFYENGQVVEVPPEKLRERLEAELKSEAAKVS